MQKPTTLLGTRDPVRSSISSPAAPKACVSDTGGQQLCMPCMCMYHSVHVSNCQMRCKGVAYRKHCVEDEVVFQGLLAAVGDVEVAGVRVLLMEWQHCEHCYEAVPVGELPPQAQHVGMPSLQAKELLLDTDLWLGVLTGGPKPERDSSATTMKVFQEIDSKAGLW